MDLLSVGASTSLHAEDGHGRPYHLSQAPCRQPCSEVITVYRSFCKLCTPLHVSPMDIFRLVPLFPSITRPASLTSTHSHVRTQCQEAAASARQKHLTDGPLAERT